MRAGESLVGNAILFVSLLATVGIGALAAVGLIIAAWRRRVRLPLDRSRLPPRMACSPRRQARADGPSLPPPESRRRSLMPSATI